MLAFLFVMPFVSSEAWNLGDAEYLGISTFVEGYEPRAVSFNQNGSNMYILDANYDSRSDLYQYSCSIPWQVESCVYVTEINLNDSRQQWDLFFDENGTRLYVLEMGDIKQYSLSVPWDIMTISFDGLSVDLPHDVRGIQFSPEGSRLYIVNSLAGKETFYQYNCSESWNLSTCSQGASFSSRDEVAKRFKFSADGTRFYELGTYASTFHQYSCSLPWELGTCSYDSITLPTRAGGLSSSDFEFSSDGVYMYELSEDTGELFQYIMEYSDIYVLGPRDFETSTPNTPGLYVRVSDEEGDPLDVRFYDASDDSLIGEKLNVDSDSKVLVYWENLTWGETYEWYVETSDGVNNITSDIYTFTVLDSFDSCMTFRVPGEYILQSDIVNAPANCFYVAMDNVVINGNGYSLTGIRDEDYTAGIKVYYANDVVIKNFANISDFFHGIHVIGGNNNTIFNVTSSFNPSNGITVQQSERSSVLNSTVYSNRNGIVLAFGGGLHVASGNKIYSNDGYGIYIDTLETPSGIEFFEDYNVIRENEIYSNTKGGYYSKASNYNYVFLNEIYSNGWGVEIYDSSNGNLFHNNSIYWNPLGVEIYGCQNNEFAYNFFNNTVNTEFVIPASNSWNNTFGGNWWATASGDGYSDTCIDFDFDGFCDYVYDVQYDARDCSSTNCDYMPYAMEVGQPSGMDVLTDCLTITEPGEYILLKDVTNDGLGVDGNCFSIYADNVTLDGNFYELIGDFDNSGFGIHVSSANNVVIKNFKNISGFNDAIIFNSAENGIITDVNISNNENYGIYFSSSVNNTVTDTLVEGISNYGVYVAFGSDNLFFNNIFNNSNNVNNYLSSNFWNNSKIGNFWFNPVSESVSELCDDLNIDGICDSSYDVVLDTTECSSGNCDYLPKSTKTLILTDCATISASGNYALGNDITNGTGGVVGTCIRIDADNVILNGNGYKIVGDGIGTIGEIGVYIDRSVNTTVKNFKEISGFGRGVYSYFEGNHIIINNTIINNIRGMEITFSNYINATNNSIFESIEYGVYASGTINSSITNNIVNGNSDYGVQLQSPDGLFFDGNVILNSATGINVYMTSRNNIFSNNNISFNSMNGLAISTYYENNTVEKNVFSYNGNGISSSDLRDVIVRENSFISNNLYAMDINGFIPGHVYNNSFNGMNHIDYTSSTNYRSMNNSLIGNWWTKPSLTGYSEYCFDLNSDGFCDNPYNYKTSKEDRFCYSGVCDYLPLSTEVGRDSYILPSYPRYNQDIVSLNPTLTVRPIRDSWTTFTVRFYDASDDSLIGEFFNVPNNETVEFVWDNLNMGEEYSWYSVAEDGSGELRSPTWNFKTYTEQLTECTTIKYPGTYVLQNDIQAEETCFVIEAENVVIDGNGYSLSGSGAYYGILFSDYVESLRNVTIKNFNEISNFSNGIRILDSNLPRTNFTDIKIINNSFIDNQYGIYIQGYSTRISKNNLISGNIFKLNSYAFYLYYFSDSVFEKNWFSDNGNFIRHTSTSKIFFQNEFYSNIFNQTPGNFTFALFQPMNWSNSEGGNYWANSNGTGFSQTCLDSDGNGFCDSPYNVEYMKYINFTTSELESSSENVDYLPLSILPGWFTGVRYIEPEEESDSFSAGGSSTVVFKPTEDDLSRGYKGKFLKGKQIVIEINNQEYVFEISEVNDNDTIISLGNEKISLNSVSDIKLDLDGDGRYDLKITSTEILRARVDLEFVLIDEEVPKEEVVLESSEDNNVVDGQSKFASILHKVWIRWVIGGLGAILLAWFVLKKFYRK